MLQVYTTQNIHNHKDILQTDFDDLHLKINEHIKNRQIATTSEFGIKESPTNNKYLIDYYNFYMQIKIIFQHACEFCVYITLSLIHSTYNILQQ